MTLVQGWFRGCLRMGLVLGISGALSLACSGKSDDEDGEDEANCTSLCEKAASCPDVDPRVDCAADCRESEDLVDSYGCRAEFDRYFACVAELPDACNLDLEKCDAEFDAINGCLSGDPPSTCTEGGAPRNATCVALCERAAGCAGPNTDCATDCADAARQVAEAGCTAEYQDYMDCISTCTDACSVTANDCPSSFAAFASCLTS